MIRLLHFICITSYHIISYHILCYDINMKQEHYLLIHLNDIIPYNIILYYVMQHYHTSLVL